MSGNRVFRVFISSTFEDFQAEREMLRERVWPEIERLCELRGASFEAIDLRWGIPANAAEELDIVSICLGEVERCRRLSPRPNFLALVGDRYGWRPLPVCVPLPAAEGLPAEARSLLAGHYRLDENAVPPAYVVDRSSLPGPEAEAGLVVRIRDSLAGVTPKREIEDLFFKSATHLEIEDGVLSRRGPDAEDHFLACFRDIRELRDARNSSTAPPGGATPPAEAAKYCDRLPDGRLDPEAAAWMSRMRADLEARAAVAGALRRYETSLEELRSAGGAPYLEALRRDVETWLTEKLAGELGEPGRDDELELERLEQRKFLEGRARGFGGRGRLMARLRGLLGESGGQRVLCLHGPGGSGKSAIMARLVADAMRDLPGARVLYRFIGATPGSVELHRLLGGLAAELRPGAPVPEDLEGRIEALGDAAGSAEGRRTILFLDALDQLDEGGNARSLAWLPLRPAEGFALVVSALDGPMVAALRSLYTGASFVDLASPEAVAGAEDAGAMLDAMLAEAPPRRLAPAQRDYVLARFAAAPLPLYLKLAAANARRWMSFEPVGEIDASPRGLEPSVEGQVARLVGHLASEDRHGPVFTRRALGIIALSREGASAREIADALWLDGAYRAEFDRRKHARQPEVDALPPIVWSRFYYEIESFLMERLSGGSLVLGFFHRVFAEVLVSLLDGQERLEIHGLLARCFSASRRGPVRRVDAAGRVTYDQRALTELPYHQARSGDRAGLEAGLTDLVFLDAKARSGKAYELLEDFGLAEELDGGELRPAALIARAYRSELHFIARHPESLFQALYNACRWEDGPGLSRFLAQADEAPGAAPPPGPLGLLMEDWALTQALLAPRSPWLRSLSPPPTRLDGYQRSAISGLSSPTVFAAFSPDGARIAAVCNGGELVIVDAESRKIERLERLSEERSFIFKPNSKRRFGPGTEVLGESGGSLADHPGFEYWAWPGIASPDGSLALGGSRGGVATLRRFTETGCESVELDPRGIPGYDPALAENPVRALALSADRSRCAVGHADGSLVVWDLASRRAEALLRHGEGWVNGAALSADGSVLVSGGGDGLVYVWRRDPASGSYSGSGLPGHADRVWVTAVSADGALAASGSDDRTVRLWDLGTGAELARFAGHARWVQALAFSPDKSRLASSGGDGRILLWDLASRDPRPALELPGHDDSVLSLGFSPDGGLLVSAGRDRSVRVWDLRGGRAEPALAGHRDRITCLRYSRDGLVLVTGSNDGGVRRWDAATGRPLGPELHQGAPVSAIAAGPDARELWVGRADGSVEVVGPGGARASVAGPGRRVYALELSADSRLALSADEAGRVCLFDARIRKKLCDLVLEGESPLSAAISPDGRRAAVGLRSGAVALLALEAGGPAGCRLEAAARREVADSWIDGLAFSADGRLLEARGGSWRTRAVLTLDARSLEPVAAPRPDGPPGAFGGPELRFGQGEASVGRIGPQDAYLPKALELAAVHPSGRQWAAVQRYNLAHFRLEGGGATR